MKKLVFLLPAMAIILALTGCSNNDSYKTSVIGTNESAQASSKEDCSKYKGNIETAEDMQAYKNCLRENNK